MRYPLMPVLVAVLALALASPASAAPKKEIRGAAILEHPCGKVSVKHMGLVHAGKMDEALALASKELRDDWNAQPADQRKMMLGMMREMSSSEADYSAQIKAGGVLVVEGDRAVLTVTQEHKDENGSSSSVQTESFLISGSTCTITD